MPSSRQGRLVWTAVKKKEMVMQRWRGHQKVFGYFHLLVFGLVKV